MILDIKSCLNENQSIANYFTNRKQQNSCTKHTSNDDIAWFFDTKEEDEN